MARRRAAVGQHQSRLTHAPALVRHRHSPASDPACLRPPCAQEGERPSLAVATAQPAAEVAQRCQIAPQIGIAGEGGADILTKYHLGCTFVARMERSGMREQFPDFRPPSRASIRATQLHPPICFHENWILRCAQGRPDTHGMADAIIAAQDICKRFGSVDVLRGVNLAVAQGDVVCIIGPSGSGKTTLLRCFALLEAPSGGRIVMRERIIAQASADAGVKRSAKAVRADIGMVFQHFNLWPHMTALENIIEAPLRVKRMGRGDAVALGEKLLAKVGLSEKRDVYPGRLSGGQQQRVAIARALAMSPQVILFDEVTSALDPELRHEVLEVIRELAEEGMTMVLVTHEMAFAHEVATSVAFMSDGAIVEMGPPSEVMVRPQNSRTQAFLARFHSFTRTFAAVGS